MEITLVLQVPFQREHERNWQIVFMHHRTRMCEYIFPCILKQVTTGCWVYHFRTNDLRSTYSRAFGNNNQYCRVQMNSQAEQSNGAAVRVPVPGEHKHIWQVVFEHSDVLVNLVCYFTASYFNENFLNTKERIIYKKKILSVQIEIIFDFFKKKLILQFVLQTAHLTMPIDW